jgi:DNA polymerase-3 subunit delta
LALLEPQKLYPMIEKSIAEQSFAPVYVFVGEEAYLVQQAVVYLRAAVMEGVLKDFNYSVFFAEETDVSKIIDEVETLPMMSPHRMVILKDIDQLTEKKWDELSQLFTNPVSSTVFLLVGEKLDKRKKSYKLLESNSVFVEFKKPYDNQIPAWIIRIAKTYDMVLSNEALQLLHRLVGNQLIEIDAELKKLREFCEGKTDITAQDVALCVSRLKEESVFEFARQVAKADLGASLEQLIRLMDQGQSEIGIVHLVARHFRILLQVRNALAEGVSSTKIATLVQIPQFFIKEYIDQARVWTVRRLEQALLVCGDCDKALKSSPLSSAIWLENMVLKLASMQKVQSAGQSVGQSVGK